MEENLKAKNLIQQVKTLCGRTLTVDEAQKLLLYDEVAVANAVDVLTGNVNKGSVIGNAFRYLETILSRPVPVFKENQGNTQKGNRNAPRATARPSGMPITYHLSTMPKLTHAEAYAEIEKIELHGNGGLDKLLGKEMADKLRHRVCENIAARIDWNAPNPVKFDM
jgi:hypothetical protein